MGLGLGLGIGLWVRVRVRVRVEGAYGNVGSVARARRRSAW